MSSEKSTNVRPSFWVRSLQLLDRLSPGSAGWVASRLFLHPGRPGRPEREAHWLRSGWSMTIPGPRGPLAAWRWESWASAPRATALLVHGWAGRGSQLGALVAPLLGAGYRVITFDAPAHGDTAGQETNLVEMAAAIRAVVDHVGGVDAVVAHSFGAAATTLALAQGADIGRVAYLAPMAVLRDGMDHFTGFLGLSDAAAAAFRRHVERRVGVPTESLEMRLRAVTGVPLLVLHDEEDGDVPIDQGEKLVARWPGARLVRLRGLGHRRLLRDDGCTREILGFFARGGPTAQEMLDRELFDRELRLAA